MLYDNHWAVQDEVEFTGIGPGLHIAQLGEEKNPTLLRALRMDRESDTGTITNYPNGGHLVVLDGEVLYADDGGTEVQLSAGDVQTISRGATFSVRSATGAMVEFTRVNSIPR